MMRMQAIFLPCKGRTKVRMGFTKAEYPILTPALSLKERVF
jgi:hypothetical protein